MATSVTKSVSTAWIQNLRKADLEAELARVKQPVDGNRDDLRKRLKDYVRSNPAEFVDVVWVYQSSTDILKEELREIKLSDVGEFGELARRLAEYVRVHAGDYSIIREQDEPVSVMVESYKPPILDIVRKWNLKFGPDDSVYSFLERLGELKLAYNISDKDMMICVPELMKGSTILWYRNNSSHFRSWSDFLIAFKDRYLPLDVDDALMDEIRLRTQGKSESVADYVMAMRTLLRRLSSVPSPESQLRTIMKNLRPEVRLYIRECDVDSISKLLALGKEYERLSREVERYKPPPNRAQSISQETAFVEKGSKSKYQLNSISGQGSNTVINTNCPISARPPRSYSNSGNQNQRPVSGTVRCWNCMKSTHFFRDCTEPKKLFCHLCGKPDKTVYNCGCRDRANQGN